MQVGKLYRLTEEDILFYDLGKKESFRWDIDDIFLLIKEEEEQQQSRVPGEKAYYLLGPDGRIWIRWTWPDYEVSEFLEEIKN
jgi:hypothetical protein